MTQEHIQDLVDDSQAPPQRNDVDEEETGAHPAGLHRVLFIITAMILFGLVPYGVPGLEQFQAWHPGEALLFEGLFKFEPPIERPEIASRNSSPSQTQSDEELLASAPLPLSSSSSTRFPIKE